MMRTPAVRVSRRAVLGLLLGAALGGCSGGAESAIERVAARESAPAYGDTYIDSLLGNVSTLIPNITGDAASHEVGGLLYSGLVTFDRDLNPEGELAQSWVFSDDCRQLTFHLRPNVTWHDGKPFVADDVVFTWQMMMDPKTPGPYRSDFEDVESVEAPDPATVRIHYRQPYAKALTSWSMPVLARHALERYVREGHIREAGWETPVGTGPYRLQELRSGDRVVLAANPTYFEGRPYIARVVFRVIPSQATQFLELKAKGVDGMALTAIQYKRQTEYRAFERAFHKYRYAGNSYVYVGFNLRDPRFADRRVRQAFAHAIDRQALIDGVRLGLGREATGPYKPGSWVYTDRVRRYPFDMARARALLAEAGWNERDADGFVLKNGRRFTFELITNQGNDERAKIAQIVQAQLRELGVGVEIRVLEWAAFLKERVRKRNFEALVMGWGIGIDPDQFGVWHSSQQSPDQLNHIGYANPEADAMLEAGRATCVPQERIRYYHRLQEILAEDEPIIFLYFQDSLPVVSARVHGIDPGPNGIRYNFVKWFVPKAMQRYTAG